jgi:trehalose 6-phosphate phosphatase
MTIQPQLSISDRMAIFLDFDGTLVDIAERPDLVRIRPELLTTLQQAHDQLAGALAFISGRSIADLDKLVAPLRLPTAGVHGLEYRDNSGKMHAVPSINIPDHVRDRLVSLAATDTGLILEDKGTSLAMHYRQSPAKESIIRAELEGIFLELGSDFMLQNGKMVLELRPAAATKGKAVRKFMSELPFAGRLPVFIGDDITDEDAFRAVNKMQGYSVRVGDACGNSAARYTLTDVAAVHDWIIPLVRR